MNKKKVQKKLSKKCPDCYGDLELVIHTTEYDGVSYCDTYEECLECGYQKKVVNKHNRNEKIVVD